MSQQAKTSPCPIKSQPSRPDPTPAHTCSSLHDGGIPRSLRLYAGVHLRGRRRGGGMVQIVEGRSCKGCTLCCKVLAISELEKPRATWCTHCDVKAGCKIHGAHPAECRDFHAATSPTRRSTSAGPRADRRSCSPTTKLNAPRLSVHVDPARPDSWRQEPYYSQIKRWAVAAVAQRGQVIVWQGRSTIAVLPDRDQDLARCDRTNTSSRRQSRARAAPRWRRPWSTRTIRLHRR